ncbi:MAG: GGDEF domain-containing protein [Gammaproteobacteria bacterium]|nr:GGDEF domain-containing protein [Gammaproteobacteria bacterium]
MPNREAYARRLVEEFERWRRYARPVSLALCDVDHFKKVNDRHGHAVGDTVLRDVATTLRNHLRETDFLARYGGGRVRDPAGGNGLRAGSCCPRQGPPGHRRQRDRMRRREAQRHQFVRRGPVRRGRRP